MTLRLLAGVLLVLLAAPEISQAKGRPPVAPVTFYTVERPETFGPLTLTRLSVSCDEGDQVLSGGYTHTTDQPDLQVSASFPAATQTGVWRAWIIQIQNFSETLSYEVTVFARCARVN